jgi:hypothetical protein
MTMTSTLSLAGMGGLFMCEEWYGDASQEAITSASGYVCRCEK